MTTIIFAVLLLIALAVVGHFATPVAQRPSAVNPFLLVRRGMVATLATGRMSWSARQTIA